MQNNIVKENNFIIIAIMLSLAMIISIASRFSFVFSIQVSTLLLMLIPAIYLCNMYKFKTNSYITFSVLLLLICLISYFYADYKINVRDNIIVLSSSLIAGFNMMFLSTDMKKKVLMVPVFIALWLSMVIFSKFISSPQDFLYGKQFYDIMALNVNTIASFLVLVYPLTFICIKSNLIKSKKIFVVVTLFILFSIMLTKNNIAIILSLISTFIFLLEYRKNKYVKILLPIISVLILYCLIYVSILNVNVNIISEKFILWKTALSIFKENIFFGCGLGNYAILFKAFRPELTSNTSFAYNIVIQLISEIGILGLFSFILLIISFYTKILDRIIENKDLYFYLNLCLSFTSFLIINIVDYSFFIPANMLMFFIISSAIFSIDYNKVSKEKINTYIILILFIIFGTILISPILSKMYYKKGIDLYVVKQYKSAIDEFSKSIKFDKKNPEYYTQVARAYFALYDQNRGEAYKLYIDKAIEYVKEAIKLHEYDAHLKVLLAAYYWNNENKEEAIKTMQEAIKYDKFNKEYQEYLFELKNS